MNSADRLFQLPAGSIHLKGRLGKALQLTVKNRLKRIDYGKLVNTFRTHQDCDGNFRGEFWGKIVRSAIRILQVTPDPELEQMIHKTVADLCSSADPDGCITAYPKETRCSDWDVWGRKYVLLGLERYYRVMKKDRKVLQTIRRQVEILLEENPFSGPSKIGYVWHDGLALFSILGAIEIAARLTGEKRFYEAAAELVKKGCTFSGTLFKDFKAGLPPADLANGKAYEMTSCFEGLLEIYRDTGNREYLELCERYFQDIMNCEMMVHGVGGGKDRWGEYWYNGAERQIEEKPDYAMGETCVITTFLRYAFQLLRLTGNSKYADAIEYTVYNGAMGAMKFDGSWWMHRNVTPLAGISWKRPAGDQLPGYGEDCCLAQGPEALGVGGAASVMQAADGLAVNFFENMEVSTRKVSIRITGNYPAGDTIMIEVNPQKKCDFTLYLRIPGWCTHASIKMDGKMHACAPGRYAEIKRTWQGKEKIILYLPMPVCKIEAPCNAARFAVRRGPVLLVQDSRIGKVGNAVDLPVGETPEQIKIRGIEDTYCWSNGLQLCDYASAGNRFEESNTLCVWLKQKKSESRKTGSKGQHKK